MSVWELILVEIALCVVLVLARMWIPEKAEPVKTIVVWIIVGVAIWVFIVAIGLIGALQRIMVPHV